MGRRATDEIDRLREELEMVRRDQERLSNSQIDVVEIIESLEKDVLERCKKARSLILFNEHPKSIEQRTKEAVLRNIHLAHGNKSRERGRGCQLTIIEIDRAIDSVEVTKWVDAR